MDQDGVLVMDDTDDGTKIDAQTVEPIIINGKEYVKVTTKYNAASWFLNKKNKIIVTILIILAVIAVICTLGIILGFFGIIVRSITTRVQIKAAARRISSETTSLFAGRRLKEFSLKTMVDYYIRLKMPAEGGKDINKYFQLMKDFSKFLQKDLAREFARRGVDGINGLAHTEVEIVIEEGEKYKSNFVAWVEAVRAGAKNEYQAENMLDLRDQYVNNAVLDANAFLYNTVLDGLYDYFKGIVGSLGNYKIDRGTEAQQRAFYISVLEATKVLCQYKKIINGFKESFSQIIKSDPVLEESKTKLKNFAKEFTRVSIGNIVRIIKGEPLETKLKSKEAAAESFMYVVATEIANYIGRRLMIPTGELIKEVIQFLKVSAAKILHDFDEIVGRSGLIIWETITAPVKHMIKISEDGASTVKILQYVSSLAALAGFLFIIPWIPIIASALTNYMAYVKRTSARGTKISEIRKDNGIKTGDNQITRIGKSAKVTALEAWEHIKDIVVGYNSEEIVMRFFAMFSSPIKALMNLPSIPPWDNEDVDELMKTVDSYVTRIKGLKSGDNATSVVGLSKSGSADAPIIDVGISIADANLIKKLDHDPQFFKIPPPTRDDFEKKPMQKTGDLGSGTVVYPQVKGGGETLEETPASSTEVPLESETPENPSAPEKPKTNEGPRRRKHKISHKK